MPTLDNNMMRAIIMDHYSSPLHKHEPKDNTYVHTHMHSSNCIDDIEIYLKKENDTIVDCCFTGVACTIAQASTDILCDLVIGKNVKDAYNIIENYLNMMQEKPFDEDVLDEAIVFINTSKQAARIRCATIGWNGLKEILDNEK